MKLCVLKLGTKCRDKATGLTGTLTHWNLDMMASVMYLFQPYGLDEEGQPVPRLFLCLARIEGADDKFEEVEVPFEILGTQVKNEPSGFEGMAIEFVRHINGCFHVVLQPAGMIAKKNIPIRGHDFDLRECTGEKIPQLGEVKLKQSKKDHPSPTGGSFHRVPTCGDELNRR